MKNIILVLMGFLLVGKSFSQTNTIYSMQENIHQVFNSFATYNRFNGSVIISQDDKILYKNSFGYADVESKKLHTEKTIFSLASVTKPLTAVGIMKLVEEGKLNLSTSISTYFPNFIPKYSKKITIRHLLNHSSGMQANIGRKDAHGNGLMPNNNAITAPELFEEFKETKLKFEPGKGYEYNNFGYILLAEIIENVTSQSYANYMKTAVFKPANMLHTAVNKFKINELKSISYSGLGLNEYTKLKSSIHYSWLKGAGNINSTTEDLYNFLNALENGKILKPISVRKLFNLTQARGVNNSSYGLGWRIQNKGDDKWINHTGLLPGVATIIGILPSKKIKIIILSNATTTDLFSKNDFQGKEQFVDGEIINTVIDVLQGNKTKLLPQINLVKNNITPDYSKSYALDAKHSILIKKRGKHFTLETKGQDLWSIFTYQFSRDAKEDNKACKAALFFAKAMSTQNFEGLTVLGNSEMKAFLGSEKGINQLKGMWTYFLQNAGNFKTYNIYNVKSSNNSKNVHIRFHFEKDDVGFVLGFNKGDKIQGMFLDDDLKTSTIKKVILTQINQHEFFINGHQHKGMQDMHVKVSQEELIINDNKSQFKAKLIDNKR